MTLAFPASTETCYACGTHLATITNSACLPITEWSPREICTSWVVTETKRLMLIKEKVSKAMYFYSIPWLL